MGLNTNPIAQGTIPYPDIQNGVAMDESIFDGNNTALLNKVNEAVARINNILAALQSTTDGDSGADQIKMTSIIGVNTASLQTAIESLKLAIDTIVLNAIPNGSIGLAQLNFTPMVVDANLQQNDTPNIAFNYIKTVAPTASENYAAGYKYGDLWWNTTTGLKYRCVGDGSWEDYFKLYSATAGLYGQNGTTATMDTALKMAIPMLSYFTFCTSTNSDFLDIAFGKNNTTRMLGIGLQMAMYAYYKGESEGTVPYTNLKLQQTANDAVMYAYNEIRSSMNLINLIMNSPFMKNLAIDYIPMPGDIPCAQSSGSWVWIARTTSQSYNFTAQTLTVNRSGYYRIKGSVYGLGTSKLRVNGADILSIGVSYQVDRFLNSGDVITVQGVGTTETYSVSPIVLCTSKPVIYPTTPSAGARIIQYAGAPVDWYTSGANITTFSAVPNAGTYRLAFYGELHVDNNYASAYFYVKKNGTTIQTITCYDDGVVGYPGAITNSLYTYDISCSAGDIISIDYAESSSSYTYGVYGGATLSINANDNFPA